MNELVLSVSDFVAVFNQTLEYAYPSVTIVGELTNYRISKNRWVYFDLKDDYASVKFFGSVQQLPGPLEEGLMLQVRGIPRLHPLFGFSVNVQYMSAVGEGSLKKAAALLEAKLAREGLFDEDRKRPIPYPPQTIGLITSSESAAYHDFVKILNERWGGVHIKLADVQVQGEVAPEQIVAAISSFNAHAHPVDVLVITRGGGSADDLVAFSTEQVTRAVAGSCIPTMVAIGHEVDVSLAELAADKRASTPSNAAQLLVPDKKEVFAALAQTRRDLDRVTTDVLKRTAEYIGQKRNELHDASQRYVEQSWRVLAQQAVLLNALSPQSTLNRGYAIVRRRGKIVTSAGQAKSGDAVNVQLSGGSFDANIIKVDVQ